MVRAAASKKREEAGRVQAGRWEGKARAKARSQSAQILLRTGGADVGQTLRGEDTGTRAKARVPDASGHGGAFQEGSGGGLSTPARP